MNTNTRTPPSIGLTGGIASGKSTVSRLFAELGAEIIDTDEISRELVQPGSDALARIIAHFGSSLCRADGELDRNRLRQIIFSDPDAKLWLESLLHPLIRKAVRQRLAASQSDYVIVVVPLLLDSRGKVNGSYSFLDKILVIDCPESLQTQRLMQRDGCSREQAEKIIASQASRQQRLAAADDAITNDGALSSLQHQVKALDEKYRQL